MPADCSRKATCSRRLLRQSRSRGTRRSALNLGLWLAPFSSRVECGNDRRYIGTYRLQAAAPISRDLVHTLRDSVAEPVAAGAAFGSTDGVDGYYAIALVGALAVTHRVLHVSGA